MTTEQEHLARLQVLVAIARADGEVQPWEQTLLSQACSAIAPKLDVTPEQLLSEKPALDSLLAKITTPELQQITYNEAIAFAQLDGITLTEHRLLERIRSTFKLSALPSTPPDLQDAESASEIDWSSTAASGRSIILGMRRLVNHSHRARELVLDYAIGAAMIGLIPIPGVWLIQLLMMFVLLIKMMRDVGSHWGFPKGRDMFALLGNLLGGIGALAITLMAWFTVFVIGLVVPIIRGLALAASFFTLTWTLGQMTNHFYMSSSRLDIAALRRASMHISRQERSLWHMLCSHLTRLRGKK